MTVRDNSKKLSAVVQHPSSYLYIIVGIFLSHFVSSDSPFAAHFTTVIKELLAVTTGGDREPVLFLHYNRAIPEIGEGSFVKSAY